jgi:hypothetical protein
LFHGGGIFFGMVFGLINWGRNKSNLSRNLGCGPNFPEEYKMLKRKKKEKETDQKPRKRPRKRAKKDEEKALQARKVEFLFAAPEAPALFLAGEFNHWEGQKLPMQKRPDGAWSAQVSLPPGRYEFKPMAADSWIEDCPCEILIEGGSFNLILEPERIANPYGTTNLAVWVK